jgi:hypothetical protein
VSSLRLPTARPGHLALGAAVAAGAFVVGLAPVADGDLWWHLAAGREIVHAGAPLRVDPFSAGALGRPWIDVHWLFQLAAYGLHAAGGLAALVVAKAALVAVGALILFAAVGRAAGPRARLPFALALVASLFAARGLLLLRPVIPTLALLAGFFYLLERHRLEGRAAWLVPLPFLQLLWANLQGLSMLGPALVAAYAVGAALRPAGERRAARDLGLALLLSLAACAATPYGLAGLALPFKLLFRLAPGADNVYAANVAENLPPFAAASAGQFTHLAWYLGLTAIALVAARRMLLPHLLVLAGLVALALAANRNVLLLYWLGTPLTIIAVAPALERVADRWRRPSGLTAAVALAGVLALAGVAAAREPSLAAPAPFRAPVESARVIAARADAGAPTLTGTIFAADQYGGYLIWALAPRFRPYMDTRLVLRTPDEFAEYLSLVDDPPRFDDWEAQHPVDYVALPVGYPDRYLGLAAHLAASSRWVILATDGAEVLFGRRADAGESEIVDLGDAATVDALVADVDRRFASASALAVANRLQLATLALAVGQAAQAERVLAATPGPDAEALRARARLAAGDLDAAARAAEGLLARDGDDVRGLDVLAVVEARRGDTTKAVGLLRRALDIAPHDREARRLLDTWEARP